jgi:L-ascorbate metabolism protein UlaG (beta-lactamase superfamily)
VTNGSGQLLKITYFGRTSFGLESKDTSVLLNPGIWDGKPVVPDDRDVRIIVATNHFDDAVGNAAAISSKSKAWILGNEQTIEKAKSQGGKPWLLHILKLEETYQIPGLKIVPYSLQRADPKSVSYLGDTVVRGPFGQIEADVMIVPVGDGEVFAVKDAVSLCIDAKPRIGIPVRWTTPEQSSRFRKYLEQFASGTIPMIMEPKQVLEIQWAAGNEFRYKLS